MLQTMQKEGLNLEALETETCLSFEYTCLQKSYHTEEPITFTYKVLIPQTKPSTL